MTTLAFFILILAAGILLALWSMREYVMPERNSGKKGLGEERSGLGKTPPGMERKATGKEKEAGEELVGLKGEVVLDREGEIVFPEKGKKEG